MTEDRTIDDDKAVLAAEFGYMTNVIEEALDRLGRPEEGILGELGMLISALAELADDARCKVAPPIVDALTAAVVAAPTSVTPPGSPCAPWAGQCSCPSRRPGRRGRRESGLTSWATGPTRRDLPGSAPSSFSPGRQRGPASTVC